MYWNEFDFLTIQMSGITFRLMTILIFNEYIILLLFINGMMWTVFHFFYPAFLSRSSIVISHFEFCCIFRRCSKINIYQQPHLSIFDASSLLKIHNFPSNQY